MTASEEDVVAPRWVGRTLGAMAVTIRRATLDDLDVILDLRAEVAAEGVWIGAELPLDVDGDRARFTDTIESPAAGSTDVMFVAVRDDGTVVGNLSMQQRAGIATLGMAISLHHRGAGIGGALMAAAGASTAARTGRCGTPCSWAWCSTRTPPGTTPGRPSRRPGPATTPAPTPRRAAPGRRRRVSCPGSAVPVTPRRYGRIRGP